MRDYFEAGLRLSFENTVEKRTLFARLCNLCPIFFHARFGLHSLRMILAQNLGAECAELFLRCKGFFMIAKRSVCPRKIVQCPQCVGMILAENFAPERINLFLQFQRLIVIAEVRQDRNSTVEQEITETLDSIYKKIVPTQVRDFIERKNAPDPMPVEEEISSD